MNNLQKAINWRLQKMAASPSSALLEAARVGSVIALPWVGGNMAGRAYNRITSPKTQDLDKIQSKYVTAKLEQAIEGLEQKKKMQALKESLNGNTPTLRI
jgi:hypothetical protein